MKLYAKTTSERASKGQGGQWLKIEVLNEYKKLLGIINIFPPDKNNRYGLISYNWLVGMSQGWQVRSKGIMEAKDTEVIDRRDKGEWSCFQCNFQGTEKQVEDHNCEKEKGKKEKGE